MTKSICTIFGLVACAVFLLGCELPVHRTAFLIAAPIAGARQDQCRAAVAAVRAYALARGYSERPASPATRSQRARFVIEESRWGSQFFSTIVVDCLDDRLEITAAQNADSGTRESRAERQRLYEHLLASGRFPRLALIQRDYQATIEIVRFAP